MELELDGGVAESTRAYLELLKTALGPLETRLAEVECWPGDKLRVRGPDGALDFHANRHFIVRFIVDLAHGLGRNAIMQISPEPPWHPIRTTQPEFSSDTTVAASGFYFDGNGWVPIATNGETRQLREIDLSQISAMSDEASDRMAWRQTSIDYEAISAGFNRLIGATPKPPSKPKPPAPLPLENRPRKFFDTP